MNGLFRLSVGDLKPCRWITFSTLSCKGSVLSVCMHTWLHFKGNYRCGSSCCPCCSHISRGEIVHSSVNGKEFKIESFYNCNTCDLCHIQYVGRNTRSLQNRFNEQLYSVKKKKTFNKRGQNFNNRHVGDMSAIWVQIIEKVQTPRRGGCNVFRWLCKREVFWIFQLQTCTPMNSIVNGTLAIFMIKVREPPFMYVLVS